MAIKSLSPKLLKNLRFFIRPLNSSTSSSSISAISSLNLAQKPEPALAPASATVTKAPSILDLNNHQSLFSSIPTKKLLHASLILQMAALEPIVDLGMWVLNSRLMEMEIVRNVILGVVRRSFYEHFCGGENSFEAVKCVRRLNEFGLRAKMDFAVEFTVDNDACDRNFNGFLQAIEAAKSLPSSSVSSVVVKITAICPLNLLERISDQLRWQQKDPSLNLPWKDDTFPIFSNSSPLYHTLKKPEPLTIEEEEGLLLAQQRLLKLCEKCVEANLPLVIDAEHTAVQPAIDYLTYLSAIKYNKDDNPIVYGTIQAYLKDAKERLLLATKAADKTGVPMGFKLVRGAYMSSERKLASSLGYESPIHNSIQETHDCFNDCASILLETISNGSHGVILATHNVESGKLAAKRAIELGIGTGNYQKLEFAQLYGMAEVLSLSLKNAGFQVSKYMPYGPIDTVIPYLLRRAEENRGLLSASSLDRDLFRKELTRRLKAAIF
ncbi:proline dehydrogenase 1, mitochondrial [Jatropha curcas]|uniref:Proline dehydrogenase n=1 Tax=Jatropha curcas TaxID=180498 RepID=V9XZ65_JATCU|nr:proline dehydrogenase 1, mitochondrial [Jatropha curcas]AHE13943.1 proline dehydrogenase [Jatropha curcas]